MKFSVQQRRLFLLGMGVFLTALVLIGGFHHHDGDGGKPCWYCVAVAAALLPLAVALPRLSVPTIHLLPGRASAPAWRHRVYHYRRGPPASV